MKKINKARARHGLRRLRADHDLGYVAMRHARRMARKETMWEQGDLGSKVTMKYPACYLLGERADAIEAEVGRRPEISGVSLRSAEAASAYDVGGRRFAAVGRLRGELTG